MAPRSLSRAPLRIEAMSGHSKWSSIKHKKGAADAKRGKLFTKLARAITVAARDGGRQPRREPALGLAIQKARDASMPKDNIQRAIDRGTGEGADAAAIERVVYEGYGPGGAAILVEALTDNRNRTGVGGAPRLRPARREPGRAGIGGLAIREPGRDPGRRRSLRRGRPDAGDRRRGGGRGRGRRPAQGDHGRLDLAAVRSALESAGVEVQSAELSMEPKSTVEVGESDAPALLRLMDALEEHDDVDSVHANFDVPEEILEKAAAAS